MRNYTGELRKLGYSWGDLADQTGISQSRLKRIKAGSAPLKAGSAEYESLRNLTRRAGYQAARGAGISPDRARGIRRTISDPEAPVVEYRRTRRVSAEVTDKRYQVRILGEFKHSKTHKVRIAEGYSMAYREVDQEKQTGEAIRFAQASLGGTNWELQRMIEFEVTEYKLE